MRKSYKKIRMNEILESTVIPVIEQLKNAPYTNVSSMLINVLQGKECGVQVKDNGKHIVIWVGENRPEKYRFPLYFPIRLVTDSDGYVDTEKTLEDMRQEMEDRHVSNMDM